MDKLLVLVLMVSFAHFAVASTTASAGESPSIAVAMPAADNASTKPEGANDTERPALDPAQAKQTGRGKVLEVIDSPKYTYLRISGENGPQWLAAYKTDITKGSTVKYFGGVAMPNFYSKSLDRTFDLIIFVESMELVME